MICKKCNREVEDTTKFCPYCGSNLMEEQSNVEQPQNAQPFENETAQMPEQNASQPVYGYEQVPQQNQEQSVPYWEQKPAKMNKRKLVIPCVILALVLVVGTVAFAMKDKLSNWFHNQFASDEEYYLYVEQENRDQALEKFCKSYENYYKQYESGTNRSVSVKVELGEQLKTTLSSLGLDVSKLDSATLNMSTVLDKNIYDLVYGLQLNDTDLIKAKIYADFAETKMYMQVPELSESYLDISSALDSSTEEEKEMLSSVADYASWMPKADALKKSFVTYTDILFKGIDKAEKSSDTLTASGVSEKCTKVSVTYEKESVKKVMTDLVKAAKEDKTVTDFLEKLDEISEETSASEYIQSMEELLKEIEEADASKIGGAITMDVYVNDDGDIIGRTINLESTDCKIEIDLCKAVSDGKIGLDYKIAVDGADVFSFAGDGTLEVDAVTGDFVFTVSSEDGNSVVLNVGVKDYKVAEDGKGSGTISLSTDEVPGGSIDITFAGDRSSNSTKIAVNYGGMEWGTVALETSSGKNGESVKPESDAQICDLTDEEQTQEYYLEASSNVYTLIERLSELTGIEEENWYTLFNMDDSLLSGAINEDDVDTGDDFDYNDYDYNTDDYYEDYNDDYDYDDSDEDYDFDI